MTEYPPTVKHIFRMSDEFKVRRSIVSFVPVNVIDRIVFTEWPVKLPINHSMNAQVLALVLN